MAVISRDLTVVLIRQDLIRAILSFQTIMRFLRIKTFKNKCSNMEEIIQTLFKINLMATMTLGNKLFWKIKNFWLLKVRLLINMLVLLWIQGTLLLARSILRMKVCKLVLLVSLRCLSLIETLVYIHKDRTHTKVLFNLIVYMKNWEIAIKFLINLWGKTNNFKVLQLAITVEVSIFKSLQKL